jgi:hypothetical protein
MTTTRRSLPVISREIRETEKAITVNETPLPAELRAGMIQRFGAERVAQMDTEMGPHLAGLRERLAALRAEYTEREKTACGRCDGDGQYKAPTGHTRNGVPVCFRCGGSGDEPRRRVRQGSAR